MSQQVCPSTAKLSYVSGSTWTWGSKPHSSVKHVVVCIIQYTDQRQTSVYLMNFSKLIFKINKKRHLQHETKSGARYTHLLLCLSLSCVRISYQKIRDIIGTNWSSWSKKFCSQNKGDRIKSWQKEQMFPIITKSFWKTNEQIDMCNNIWMLLAFPPMGDFKYQ